MNRRQFFLSAFLLCLSVLVCLPGTLHSKSIVHPLTGDLNLRIYNNDITGNRANSFKTQDANVLSDVYFNYDDSIGENDDIQLNGLAYFQATDDPQFEIRNDKVRLQNAYLTAREGEKWQATAGYFSERYTSYMFNSTLLGLNTSYKVPGSDWRIKAFYGRNQRHQPNSQFDRFGWGTRAEWNFLENHMLAFSYTRLKDNLSSLDSNEDTVSADDRLDNEKMGVDYSGKLPAYNLVLGAEWANSDFHRFAGSDTSNNQAQKYEVRWRATEKTKVEAKYEEVDPNFQSELGFATSGREQKDFEVSHQLTNEWDLSVSYEAWEDGLEGETQNNDVEAKEFDVTYEPRDQGYWEKSLDFRFETRENEDPTTAPGASSLQTDEDIYSLMMENEFGPNELMIEYSLQEQDADSEVIRAWQGEYSREFRYYGMPWLVESRGFYQEDENNNGTTLQIDRSVRTTNMLVLGYNQRESLTLEHRYENEDSDGSGEIVTGTWLAEFSYILNRKADREVNMSYENEETINKSNRSQDFQEETIMLNIKTPF